MLSTVEGVSDGVVAGKVAAGARAIRWLDDLDPRGRAVLQRIFPNSGQAHVIGVTGPPGAGKSSLVDMLVKQLRDRGRKVGVLAVDPSSPFSGGAILGDRIRMQRHATDAGVFIRSMGSRGNAGGLSRAAYDASVILDAMGYDAIIVETVGVGQEEIDIVSLAHSTIIVSVPGLGDEVQAVKAGLLEAGEIFVINKADREGAADTERQMRLMLHLRESAAADPDGWQPPLLMASALKEDGGDAIVDALDRHAAHLRDNGQFERRTGVRNQHIFIAEVREQVARRLLATTSGGPLMEAVTAGSLDPYSAARTLLDRVDIRD